MAEQPSQPSQPSAPSPPPQPATNDQPAAPPTGTHSMQASQWSWGGLVGSLKQQTAGLRDACVRDLNEFVTVATEDTASVLDAVQRNMSKISATLGVVDDDGTEANTRSGGQDAPAKVTTSPMAEFSARTEQRLGAWGAGISNALSSVISLGEPQSASDQQRQQQQADSGIVLTRHEALLRELRHDQATYLVDPAENPADAADFKVFVSQFRLVDYARDISSLFSGDDIVRSLHTRIVPTTISNETWWQRYFFRVKRLMQAAEEKKQLIREHATMNDQVVEFAEWDHDVKEEVNVQPVADKPQANDGQEINKTNNQPATEALVAPLQESLPLDGSFELVSDREKPESTSTPASTVDAGDWVEWE